MDTGDDAWKNKIESLCAMFPNHARTVLESVLTINVGDIQNAANQLIDVNCADTDVQGLIQEETAVLANIKMEADQPPTRSPYLAPPAGATGTSSHVSHGSPMFRPFVHQYKLGNEPDRPIFLDLYQSFCAAQGYPCQQVPVVDFVNNIHFDLYRMYCAVVREGGYNQMNSAATEREDHLLWKTVILETLKLKPDKLALKSVKESYVKYLLDFENYYCGSTSFSSIAYACANGVSVADQSSASTPDGPSNQNGNQNTSSNQDGNQNTSSNQNGDQPDSSSQSHVDTASAPPRNKHKKIRVLTDSTMPDSVSSNVPPVLNPPALNPADLNPAGSIPPVQLHQLVPMTSSIPPNAPPTLPLTTAGIFDQSNGSGSLTSPYLMDSPLDQQGVEDAFMDVVLELEDHHNQSFLDGDQIDDSRLDSAESEEVPALPAEVIAARKEADQNLKKAQEELSETPVLFDMEVMKESDPDFDRLTDKAKIFFNLFSNSTIEIMEMYRVKCPGNKVHFYEKAASLTDLCKTVELYKSCLSIPHHRLSEDKIYKILKDEYGGRLFSLYKYAKNEAEGNLTFIVCDALLGKNIDISDRVDVGDGPNAFVVTYRNQIKLKYVINLRATKIASVRRANPYSDVPDFIAPLADGVRQIDVRTFDFRNASDPWVDVVMKATSLYNGDCIKRQAQHKHYRKRDISHLGIVICHNLWKKYEAQRRNLASNGGQEIYAYHATAPHNVESIARNNLDWRRTPVHGRAHGDGCYFSEYPEFSLKYNKHCMIIFKIILLPNMYRRVKPDSQGYCEQIIMWDDSLFKPVYVLYF